MLIDIIINNDSFTSISFTILNCSPLLSQPPTATTTIITTFIASYTTYYGVAFFSTNCYSLVILDGEITQLHVRKNFLEKSLRGPRSPFCHTPPPNGSIFYILCPGGHRNMVFTSNDAECPSLYPTCEDTILL